MTVNPQPFILKSGKLDDESATFGEVISVAKYMAENHIRYSLSSPPLIQDIKEGCCVIDKTTARLYFNVNGALKYLAMT